MTGPAVGSVVQWRDPAPDPQAPGDPAPARLRPRIRRGLVRGGGWFPAVRRWASG